MSRPKERPRLPGNLSPWACNNTYGLRSEIVPAMGSETTLAVPAGRAWKMCPPCGRERNSVQAGVLQSTECERSTELQRNLTGMTKPRARECFDPVSLPLGIPLALMLRRIT